MIVEDISESGFDPVGCGARQIRQLRERVRLRLDGAEKRGLRGGEIETVTVVF